MDENPDTLLQYPFPEDFHNARNPKCSNGKKPVPKSKTDEGPMLGKKCADKFCPTGTTCHDGKLLAFCCPK